MAKNNRNAAIRYGCQRILVETIAAYVPIIKNKAGIDEKYGIRFHLRTGESIEHMGNDELTRDKALRFLDEHFGPIGFTAHKCEACVHRTSTGRCDKRCYQYDGYPRFQRRQEDDGSTSAAMDAPA